MTAESVDSPAARHSAGGDSARRGALPLLVAVCVIGLLVPLFINIGPLRLTVYRLVLLVLFFPALYHLLSGRVGGLRAPDFCVVAICLWSSLSFSVVHGFTRMIEPIGIFWVETLGAYLIGRCYIRTPEAFHATVRLLFRLGLVMIPFAIYEAVTGTNMVVTLFDKIGPSYWDNDMDPRLGLYRVNGPFPHPIHLGVFFLSLSGVVYYVLGYGLGWTRRMGQMLAIAFLGAGALSSGPLVAFMAQIGVITWDGVMRTVRERWHILAGLSALGFVTIDLLSNRTPFHVVIEYLALNKYTAYNRIRIWQFGTNNIFDNPLFGLGFNDWARPSWMSDSIDMFWIVGAVRHGIPVWILWLALFFLIFLPVAYRRNLTGRVDWYRTGYLVTMFGLFMAGWTVHYWDVTYAFLMFLLGGGMWFLDWQGGDETESEAAAPDAPPPAQSRYTRFPAASRGRVTASGAGGAAGSPAAAPMSSRQRAAPQARP